MAPKVFLFTAILYLVFEIAVFIRISAWLGVGSVVVLSLAGVLVGGLIVRTHGHRLLYSLADQRRFSAFEPFKTTCVMLAGFLFIVPGFLSDGFAFFLLLPPIQSVLFRIFRALPPDRDGRPPFPPGSSAPRPSVIDGEGREIEETVAKAE